MNREIEFRVWDKISNRYLSSEELKSVVLSPLGVLCKLYKTKDKDGGLCYEIEWGSSLNYILEQYTGLKDKNGTKIFEGDRVKYCHEDESYLDEDFNRISDEWIESKIKWQDNHPAFDIEGHQEEYNLLSNPEIIIEVIKAINLLTLDGSNTKKQAREILTELIKK